MFTRHVRLIVPLAALLVLVVSSSSADPAKDATVDRFGDALPPHAVLRIGTTRLRHGGPITAILFAADGKTVFTASEDRTVSRWNVETGQELARHGETPAPSVVTLALAADGKTLYTGALDAAARATLSAWEIGPVPTDAGVLSLQSQPKETGTIPANKTLALAPDGKSVAFATEDDNIHLTSTAKNGTIKELEADPGLRSLTFSPDGIFLAAASDTSGVTVWNAKTAKKVSVVGKGTYMSCAAFAPDSDLLATGDFDNHVHLWDIKKQAEVATLEGHAQAPVAKPNGIFCVAFSPDGKWLATGAGDATVRLWDVARHKQAAVLEGHSDRITALAFSPDSKRLLTGGADHLLRLWEVGTGKEVRPAPEPGGPITALALHRDGQLLATIHTPNKLRLWDLTTGKASSVLCDTAAALLFLSDGKTLLTGDGDKDLFQSWDLKSGKATAWSEKAPRGIGAALAADAAGKTLVSANPSGRVVTLWDVKQGKIIQTLENNSNVVTLAMSPDGETAAAGGSATIRLWHLADGAPRPEVAGHPGGTTAMAFSGDGRLLASAGRDRMIRLWEVLSGKEWRAMGGQPGWVRTLAFDPKSRLLATGSTDGTVRLWDVRKGKLVREMTGHRGAVTGVAFTANGDRLVSTSLDATALVWNVKDALVEDNKVPPLQLKADDLDRCWKDLGAADVAVAAAAIQTLARAPEQAVPLLHDRIVLPSDAQLNRLIVALDSDDFPTRREAKAKLADAGKFAEPALRAALKNNPSAEVAARLKELLADLEGQALSPAQMRILRSIEALEMIDTKAAREALQTLAEGAKDSDVTRQAKAALERLKTP